MSAVDVLLLAGGVLIIGYVTYLFVTMFDGDD